MIDLKKSCALSIFIAILLSSVEAGGSRAKDWDYIIFTQHWPASVCLQWKSEGKGHSCAFPKESTWTVHGVWPTKNHSRGPSNCDDSLPFDEEALSPIVTKLEDLWINIDVPTSPYSFWRHEWVKHGTCAAALPAMDKEVKYFNQGLQWVTDYNIYPALQMAGFSEGKSYLPKQIREAVKDHYGKAPTIHCYRDEASGKSYLFEMRLCFNKSLQLIDCPKPFESNCPSTPVEYPSMSVISQEFEMKNKWLFDMLKIVRLIQWITY